MSAVAGRRSCLLIAHASGLEVETRIRCQSDDHEPGAFNPLLDSTFCHCGRVRYPGVVELVVWPDRARRLLAPGVEW